MKILEMWTHPKLFILLASSCIIQEQVVFSAPATSSDEEINICANSTPDAIFIPSDGKTHIFKGSMVWIIQLNSRNLESGPIPINDLFPGLENDLDTASSQDGMDIFFKGSKCWKFRNNTMILGYPKDIKTVFSGIPDDIQAASPYGKKGYIYFFKGDKYWRYEPNRQPPVRSTYPKLIREVWRGIPINLDDVLLDSNERTYFFKGMRYWRLDDKKLEVDASNDGDPYPRMTSTWWMSCNAEP